MTARNAWAGALLGLLVGVALGALILILRPDSPLLPEGDPGEGDPVPQHAGQDVDVTRPADADTDAVNDGIGEDLGGDRSNAIVRATKRVAPAVVSINVVQQQAVRDPGMIMWERMGILPPRQYYRNVRSMGSGLIVSSDGLIVTNQHVVQDAVQILVTLSDGSRYQALLRDTIARFDLAVLQIEARDLPVATLAAADDLEIGEWAIAIGSPYGYLLADSQPTVTVGVISALNRDIRKGENTKVYLGMIQTDAAINPGNSGGPLVNTSGEVVGINTFIFSDTGGSVGIGFAVPAARVATVIEEIRKYGHFRQVNLGITLSRLTPASMEYYGIDNPIGLMVTEVEEESAVWKAGLRVGDVLRELNGQVIPDYDTIFRIIYDASVGDRMGFIAERQGESWSGEILIEETE